MLLLKENICVEPDGWQLHDYMITNLEVRWLGVPGLDKPCYALVIVGSAAYPEALLQIRTSSFEPKELDNHQEFFRAWQQLVSDGRYEQSFLSFLLTCVGECSKVEVSFIIDSDRLASIRVVLGNIVLLGRLPCDTNVLSSHFNGETALSED